MNLFWLVVFGVPFALSLFEAGIAPERWPDRWVIPALLAVPTFLALASCIFSGPL